MSLTGTILTVCTANVCRSPMAEGLLRHALAGQPEPLRSLRVVSAGVAAGFGDPVTGHTVEALRKVGIDVSSHTSQPVTQELLDEALVVLCMTESHRVMIQLTFQRPPRHLYLLREFVPPPASKEIKDPFGGPLSLYETCRDEMVEAIPGLLTKLRALLSVA